MRLLLLAFVTTLAPAHAADWHTSADLPTGAVSQARSASPTAAIPRIINGVPTSDYPAVAGLAI